MAQEGTTQDKPAQNAPAAKPPKPYGGGTPLDVILHTKWWETPPEAKPFVRESREPESSLHYQPTAGVVDPQRPKLLSHNQLKSLEGELEQAGAQNDRAAGIKDNNFARVVLRKARKSRSLRSKLAKAKADVPISLHPR